MNDYTDDDDEFISTLKAIGYISNLKKEIILLKVKNTNLNDIIKNLKLENILLKQQLNNINSKIEK
jgi:hypothetical protein